MWGFCWALVSNAKSLSIPSFPERLRDSYPSTESLPPSSKSSNQKQQHHHSDHGHNSFPPVPPYPPPPPSASPPPYAFHSADDTTTTTIGSNSSPTSSISTKKEHRPPPPPPPYTLLPSTLPHQPQRHRLQKTESLASDLSDSRDRNNVTGDYYHVFSILWWMRPTILS